MSILDQLFGRVTTESETTEAAASISIIYATALADSSNGSVLVQIGDAIGADEAQGAELENEVDVDEVWDEDTTANVDEDTDAEELAEIDVEEGIEYAEDVDETSTDDEADEDTTDEEVSV